MASILQPNRMAPGMLDANQLKTTIETALPGADVTLVAPPGPVITSRRGSC